MISAPWRAVAIQCRATGQATIARISLSSARRSFQSTIRRRSNGIKNDTAATNKYTSRLDKLEARLPRYLRRYIQPLRNAPVSHLVSFLILHEITAIVPLFGLAGAFHYTQWMPLSPLNWEWGRQGVERFDKWARKKGWVTDDTVGAGGGAAENEVETRPGQEAQGRVNPIVLELGVAWAVTKALLPVRLMASVWATPWFATRVVLPCSRLFVRS